MIISSGFWDLPISTPEVRKVAEKNDEEKDEVQSQIESSTSKHQSHQEPIF